MNFDANHKITNRKKNNKKATTRLSDLTWLLLARLCFIDLEERTLKMEEKEHQQSKNKKPSKYYATIEKHLSPNKSPNFSIASDFKKLKYETEYEKRAHKDSSFKPKFFDSPMQPENKNNFYPSPLMYSSHYRNPFRYNNDDPGYFFGDYKGLSGEAMMRITKYDQKKYNPAFMM